MKLWSWCRRTQPLNFYKFSHKSNRMMEILADVGEQWDSFSEIDKSAVATSLGG